MAQTNEKATFNPGEVLYAWEAHDYHPHERGILWMIIFGVVLFGSALFFLWWDPQWGWVTASTFFIVAALYFWTHRNGDETHMVRIFEKGLLIDDRNFFPWDKFAGYWIVYDPTVSVINFQFEGKLDRKITLQMGHTDPDQFRIIFDQLEFPELKDHKESLTDLWVRALKL